LRKFDIQISVIDSDKQYKSIVVNMEGKVCYIAGVYGSTSYIARRILRSKLRNVQNAHIGPCCIFGDFHAILSSSDSKGEAHLISCHVWSSMMELTLMTRLKCLAQVFFLLGTMADLEFKEFIENWLELLIIPLLWICGIISDVAS